MRRTQDGITIYDASDWIDAINFYQRKKMEQKEHEVVPLVLKQITNPEQLVDNKYYLIMVQIIGEPFKMISAKYLKSNNKFLPISQIALLYTQTQYFDWNQIRAVYQWDVQIEENKSMFSVNEPKDLPNIIPGIRIINYSELQDNQTYLCVRKDKKDRKWTYMLCTYKKEKNEFLGAYGLRSHASTFFQAFYLLPPLSFKEVEITDVFSLLREVVTEKRGSVSSSVTVAEDTLRVFVDVTGAGDYYMFSIIRIPMEPEPEFIMSLNNKYFGKAVNMPELRKLVDSAIEFCKEKTKNVRQ